MILHPVATFLPIPQLGGQDGCINQCSVPPLKFSNILKKNLTDTVVFAAKKNSETCSNLLKMLLKLMLGLDIDIISKLDLCTMQLVILFN